MHVKNPSLYLHISSENCTALLYLWVMQEPSHTYYNSLPFHAQGATILAFVRQVASYPSARRTHAPELSQAKIGFCVLNQCYTDRGRSHPTIYLGSDFTSCPSE